MIIKRMVAFGLIETIRNGALDMLKYLFSISFAANLAQANVSRASDFAVDVFCAPLQCCVKTRTINEENAISIGRIAQGILKIIKTRSDGNWYYCGKKLSDNESIDKSVEIAYLVVNGVKRYGMDGISPWGIVATIYNESGMDACAIGPNPRHWGYENGMLKPNKMSISHTHNDIMNFIQNNKVKKRYSRTGFDLGYCQILSKFYPGQIEQLLDKVEGIDICLLEMLRRSKEHKTKRPWLYWKVSRGAQWYSNKIRRWAKMMGASKSELNKI